MAKKDKNSQQNIHYSRTMTSDNLSKAANYVGNYVLKGLGAFGKIMTAPFVQQGPTSATIYKSKEQLAKERTIENKSEEQLGKAMTWASPLNYGAALATGNGLNARKGEEEVASWSPAWQALGRAAELYAGPKVVKGVKAAPKVVVNTAAKAGVKPAKVAVVAREIKQATKNKPNLSNRTVSSERSVNGITGVPEVQYILYNEFGEPIGQTNIGGATLGHINRVSKTSNRMVDGIYSKNKAHKVSEDTYNVAIEDILNNGGVGLESGWSLMSPEKTMATTSKFPYQVIGHEFGNPVRLLTGTTKRPIPQRVQGNHYIEIKPKTTIEFDEVSGEFKEVPIKENIQEPSTSLKFFERKPSKISEAERAGVPKGKRNVKQGYLLKDAIEEANKFAEKWGYDKLSQNATLQDIENLYNQHNTFFRGVTTEQLENTRNRVAKELGINPEQLTNDQYLQYVSTHPWPGNDRIWVTPFSHYGKIYGNSDMIGGKGQLSAVMRPWKTTKDIKQWPKLSQWTLGFKEDVSNPVITPWVSNAPDAIRSLGSQSEFLVKSPLIYRGLGKDFKGTLQQQLKYNDGQGKLGWIESQVGELPQEIIIEKQGGKMNILEFLKNGSGIHIKEENKGKFTSYCGGKVTNECIQKGKNSSNPAIRKRATFAANARKWKHEDGGELIKKAQLGTQLPKAEDAAQRYKNGEFIKEFQDNNEGHAVIQGVMTNKPFHNQGSIVRKINYVMGVPSDTTFIETPPSLLPVQKVSRMATRYSNQKDNAYVGNQKDLYDTLKRRWETAYQVMRRKDGGTLKAQYGAPLNLSTEDIQGGLQYITQGLGKVWNIMNAPVVNVQPSTTAYLPNGSQIEIPGTQTGVVDDSFGKGGGGKKVGKKLLQSVAKSKDKGLNVTKKVDSAVRHGLVNVDQDLRHFGRGNRRMKPEDLIKEMDKHVELKEFAKHLSKRYSNLKRDNPQSMKDFRTLKNKYEDMLNDFLHNGIKKGQLGMALTQFNDSENPNAVGGEIVNSYIRNQLMIPYLQAQKEEYEKWKLQMKQQANTQKSSLFDNLLNTGLSIGTDYLKSKLGIGTEKADS